MPAPALLVDDLGELLDAWAVVVRGGLLVGLGEGTVTRLLVLPVGLSVAELVRFHTDLPIWADVWRVSDGWQVIGPLSAMPVARRMCQVVFSQFLGFIRLGWTRGGSPGIFG